MSRRVISEKIRKTAVESYLRGNMIEAVAKEVGVGYESVRRWVKQAGHNTSRKPSNFYETAKGILPVKIKKGKKIDRSNLRWTKDEEEILRDAVLSGMTVKDTSDLLSRSRASISCRKVQLIDRGVIPNPDVRFNMPDDIKRPRVKEGEPVIEDVIEIENVIEDSPVNQDATQEVPLMSIPELGDLAKLVKEYGVNISLSISSTTMEVKMSN